MKNSGPGSRKAPGGLIRAISTALIMAAIPVILGAGPALAADDASKPATAAGRSLVARILADQAITIEVLVILVGVALAFGYGRYRHSANGRRSAHARARGSQAHARGGSRTPPATPARQASGRPLHADDYPSWPGRPGPYALHPDHPSWPGRPDPRWAATEAALRADDYSGWPATDAPPWRDAEPPADGGGPGGPGGGGPAARREPPRGARGVPLQAPVSPVPSARPARVRGDFAPPADAAPRAAITPRPGPTGVIDRVRTEAAWVQTERVQVWDAGSVELATWIISEANQQATEIRHEARDQMAASLADAKQEAANLVAKASEQATATLTAAEQEAAEIRATVTKLTADLGGVAAQITANLVGLASPTTKPVTRPAVRPVIEPSPEPVALLRTQPAAKPGTRRAGKAGTGSAPKGQPRQLVAIRVVAAATAALFLFAVISGATEVALHGFSFFVFRSTGVGETGPTGLQEDQGPGQPDAPKPAPAHINVKPGPHSTLPNGQ